MTTTPYTYSNMTLRSRTRRRARRAVRRWFPRAADRWWPPKPLIVTIEVDTTGFVDTMTRINDQLAALQADAMRVLASSIANMVSALDRLQRSLAWSYEREILRGEARWYMRGGLQPILQVVDDRDLELDTQVQAMLAARLHPRWVAAYIHGWVASYGTGDRDPYVLHSLWPREHDVSTAVEVRA